ncbi:TSUP family transporter [Calidifontibacter terrae]
MGMGWEAFIGLGLVVGLGAFVQRIVGFGLAVVAAPFVVMLEPQLMPAALLLTVLPLPALEVARGWRQIQWPLFGWAMAGRLLTTPLGVYLVSVASSTAISLAVAAIVMVAVIGSATRLRVPASKSLSFGAGLITGVSATSASIGGPFLGLVFQEQPPRQVRATLAPFFLIGAALSFAALATAGQVDRGALLAGLCWLPFVAAGSAIAQPLRHRIEPVLFRRAMLVVATIAAVAVVARVALS